MDHVKLFFLALIGAFALGYFYYFQISPTYVEKPVLEKPMLQDHVKVDHVIYLLNELGVYKLHDNIFTGEKPLIKVIVGGNSYFMTVQENQIYQSDTGNPDMIIKCSEEILLKIYGDPGLIIQMIEKNNIQFEILKQESDLALKGYKAIYDSFSSEITGNIVKLNPKSIGSGISLSFLFLVILIVGLIEKNI